VYKAFKFLETIKLKAVEEINVPARMIDGFAN